MIALLFSLLQTTIFLIDKLNLWPGWLFIYFFIKS